ncbi:MAG TPA: methionine synthase [Candidatus Bathyarchaeia archaeon]|nr:methionine synthase [Candidatus Bathyarchaeia archaeon]
MTHPNFLYDDIGSYPLPKGIQKQWIKQAFVDLASHKAKLYELLQDALWQKIHAGVEVPTYPQFQDMISQFSEPIMNEDRTEAPLLIREAEAKIHELAAFEELAKDYKEKKGKKLKLRICVTGPIELYYKLFPPPVYTDVLSNIATSVGRFIKHAVEEARNFDIVCASLDEPSMGLDPRIEEEGIITALELASEYAYQQGIDTQIHLHSPIFYETVCQVEGVTVIGMESAAQPSLLELVDKRQLEQYDKFLRIGIARTDILSMAAEYDEIHHTNAFKDKHVLKTVVTEYNSPDKITKRLEKAYSIFGERIKYVGPDCGLGPFPSQELAYVVLKNTSEGILDFYN